MNAPKLATWLRKPKHRLKTWLQRPLACKIGLHADDWYLVYSYDGEVFFMCPQCHCLVFTKHLDDLSLMEAEIVARQVDALTSSSLLED